MRAASVVRRLGRTAAAGGTGAAVFWGGYLSVVGLAAERAQRGIRADERPAHPSTRFRILVPAHDEEELLGATLDSLNALDFPSELVEVHVVADNCTDRTPEIARAKAVSVHERDDPEMPGKGAALAWLIDRLPPGDPNDAFVVIDADTLVSPGLLTAFDTCFASSGAAAIQGYYTVKDATDGGEIGFRAAALAVRHFVRPAGRTALGGSSSLYGNAMAFRESVARSHRWSNGLTEDLEMGLRLLLDGHTVAFAPGAIVEAEMPGTLDGGITQNERWEAGRLHVAIEALPRLMGAARRGDHGRRWAYIDAAIDISLPPLTTVIAGSTLAGTSLVVLSRGRGRRTAATFAALGVGLQGLHVLHALRLADVPPEVRRSLMRTPAHVLWKSRIFARVVRRRPTSWVRTNRNLEEAAA